MEIKTFAQVMDQRQKDAREREQQVQAWCAEVTEQLANEQSKFLQDFTEAEQRILGLIQHP